MKFNRGKCDTKCWLVCGTVRGIRTPNFYGYAW